MKFTADSYGTVGGMRFYKSAANTGAHVGSLWSSDGTLLARATFSSESASGWQTVTFSQPIPVQTGQTYIVSYFAPNGHYSATPEYFYNSPAPGPAGGALPDGKPLHAVRNTGGTQNGVFNYGAGSTFPTTSFEATNYWVDPVFTSQGPAGNVTSVTASETGPNTVTINWTAPIGGGIPATYVVTPYIGSAAQTPKTVNAPATSTTINGLTAGATYRFTVRASNPSGSGAESPQSNAVTPTRAAGAVRADRRVGERRIAVGARRLDAARERRRRRDHAADGHALHRVERPDAADRQRDDRDHDVHRSLQRHDLHVQGHGDELGRHEQRRHVQRRDAVVDDLRSDDPDDRGLRRRLVARARRALQGRQ